MGLVTFLTICNHDRDLDLVLPPLRACSQDDDGQSLGWNALRAFECESSDLSAQARVWANRRCG